jgi:hypothetical protein
MSRKIRVKIKGKNHENQRENHSVIGIKEMSSHLAIVSDGGGDSESKPNDEMIVFFTAETSDLPISEPVKEHIHYFTSDLVTSMRNRPHYPARTLESKL